MRIMANEAELFIELENAIPFKVADGTGIEKGELLKLTDQMTAAKAGDDDVIAGIAASEKIANDGTTKLGVYRKGIFKMTADKSITAGDMVKSNGETTENTVISVSAASDDTENVVGVAMEDASGGDTLFVELRPFQQTWPA